MKHLYQFILVFICLLSAQTSSKAQYTLNNVFANLTDCDTMTRGIYVVWWDKDFNYANDIDELLDSMIVYRDACLNELQMSDPPNVLDGHYYNIYIHTPGNPNDLFNPLGWGNGQGTDSNGYPFLTLPNGVLNDWVNNSHECFHIFQYNANSPGFGYSGNSQWYIEATANWFAAKRNPGAPRAFIEAESLTRVPHVPLWLSFDNYPSSYPSNWQRYVHQYAMALLLTYMTDVEGVSDDIIVDGFFANTNEFPQEYLYNQLGATNFRDYFIDWAAHMLNDYDFITPVQRAAILAEWNNYADLNDDLLFIETYVDEGTNGWISPTTNEVTHAWSFNTYRLQNSADETYTFELNADSLGTNNDEAYFQGKLVVFNSQNGTSFYDLDMANEREGSLTLNLTQNDTAVYFIVASMPEVFGDNGSNFQQFPYEVNISKGAPLNITENVDNQNLVDYKYMSEIHGIEIQTYTIPVIVELVCMGGEVTYSKTIEVDRVFTYAFSNESSQDICSIFVLHIKTIDGKTLVSETYFK